MHARKYRIVPTGSPRMIYRQIDIGQNSEKSVLSSIKRQTILGKLSHESHISLVVYLKTDCLQATGEVALLARMRSLSPQR